MSSVSFLKCTQVNLPYKLHLTKNIWEIGTIGHYKIRPVGQILQYFVLPRFKCLKIQRVHHFLRTLLQKKLTDKKNRPLVFSSTYTAMIGAFYIQDREIMSNDSNCVPADWDRNDNTRHKGSFSLPLPFSECVTLSKSFFMHVSHLFCLFRS